MPRNPLTALLIAGALALPAAAALAQAPAPPAAAAPTFEPGWQKRLARILHQPTRREVEGFLSNTVMPALESVASELKARGIEASAEKESGRAAVCLTVAADKVRNFAYGVAIDSHLLPRFAVRGVARAEGQREREGQATGTGEGGADAHLVSCRSR